MMDLREIMNNNFDKVLVKENLLQRSDSDIQKSYKLSKRNLFAIFVAAMLYIADVGSDWAVAILYGIEGYYWYCIHMFIHILMPALCVTFTYRNTLKGYAKGRTFPYIILLTVATLFNIIPVIQYYENFKAVWHYLKSKGKIVEQRYHLNKYIHGNNNVVSQRIWECYFEAIPQIMIQLHIVFNRTDINWKNNSITWFQMVAICSSFVGLIITHFTEHRAYVLAKNWDVSLKGCIFFAIGRGLPIVCQLLLMKPTMFLYPLVMLVVIHIHWFAMSVSCWFTWKDKDHKFESIVWAMLVGGLLFIILPREDTLAHLLVTHLAMLLRALLMGVLWIIADPTAIELAVTGIILDCVGRVISILYWKYGASFYNKL